jgi:hypothetical protein
MSRFARLVLLALCACALAAVPATAGAAGTHGNRCGKGHAKHSRGLGKTCAKKHKGHAKRRDEAAPPAPITVPAAVVKACKDEQAADEAAFNAKYANAAGREALGRCIRINAEGGDSTTETQPAETPPATVANAAQACAAEKAADAAAFQAKYADENGREAFGHCVSQAAQAGGGDQGDSSDDQGDSSGGQGDTPPAGDGTDPGDQGDTPPADGSGDGGGGDVSSVDSLFF